MYLSLPAVPEKGANIGGIVGGVLSAFVGIGVCAFAVIFVRRRKAAKSNMYRHATPTSLSMTNTKTTR